MTGDRARRIIAVALAFAVLLLSAWTSRTSAAEITAMSTVALMTTRAGAPKPNILAADDPKAALLGASPGGCRRAHIERHGSRLS